MRGRIVPARKNGLCARSQMRMRSTTQSEHRVTESAVMASEIEALPDRACVRLPRHERLAHDLHVIGRKFYLHGTHPRVRQGQSSISSCSWICKPFRSMLYG